METAEEQGGTAQPPSSRTSKRAASDEQLSTQASSNSLSSSSNLKGSKSIRFKSFIADKARTVRQFSREGFNKLGRHLSASDQSDLAAIVPADENSHKSARLLSVSSIESEDSTNGDHRLVRTNAIKVNSEEIFCILSVHIFKKCFNFRSRANLRLLDENALKTTLNAPIRICPTCPFGRLMTVSRMCLNNQTNTHPRRIQLSQIMRKQRVMRKMSKPTNVIILCRPSS